MHGAFAAVQAEKRDTLNIQMVLPAGVRDLRARLHAAGFQTLVAGGTVRDHLLGLTPHEWGIATTAAPTEVRVLPTLQAKASFQPPDGVPDNHADKEKACHLQS
jgi:hypothetical protein